MSNFGAGFMSLLGRRANVELLDGSDFQSVLVQYEDGWLAFQDDDEPALWVPIYQVRSVQEV